MADSVIVDAQPRTIVGKKVSQLRRQGIVPITVYGPKVSPMNLQIPHRPLELALKKAGGTTLIDMKVGDQTHTVLARAVQRNTLRGDIMHADFFVVDLTVKIRTDVPLHLVGESPAVLAKQGMLITGATMVTIEVLPTQLRQQIDIDLTKLVNLGDAIHMRDLDLGAEVTIINDPDEMIARISQSSAARAEEELAAEEEAAASAEPEVIRKGKEEDEDED